MKRCLYCYQPLNENEADFHKRCVRKFFHTETLPELPYTEGDLLELAEDLIKSQRTVTGVQPKISLELEKTEKRTIPKFAIVGLWGDYILKPPNNDYRAMPETESLTMSLAEGYGLNVVPFSLIRLKSGSLAYITRRIDRDKNGKIHMEDMCQLTERLTEDKYKASYEQIGKAIRKYSVNPGLDVINFFEEVVFSFLTGNSDMHLKNFSLINQPKQGYVFSAAYDLISSKLLLPEDTEEMALTLNARRNKIVMRDFEALANSLKIDPKARERIFSRFSKILPTWEKWITISFLPDDLKEDYHQLILRNARKLNLIA
jgi:serine/threonine-protein kinase HipA